MLFIGITELEEAINYWRSKSPVNGDTLELSPHVTALSKPYALLIIQNAQRLSVEHLDTDALLAWQGYKKAIQKS
jgi:hypothetical protein